VTRDCTGLSRQVPVDLHTYQVPALRVCRHILVILTRRLETLAIETTTHTTLIQNIYLLVGFLPHLNLGRLGKRPRRQWFSLAVHGKPRDVLASNCYRAVEIDVHTGDAIVVVIGTDTPLDLPSHFLIGVVKSHRTRIVHLQVSIVASGPKAQDTALAEPNSRRDNVPGSDWSRNIKMKYLQ
jgi:hypothetical protein